MTRTKEQKQKVLQDKIDIMQKELHEFVEQIMNNSRAEYQDCVTIFFLKKVCEIEMMFYNLNLNLPLDN